MMTITTLQQLEALYGTVRETSIAKEIDHLNDDYAAFVNASPFILLATVGADGTDCSPKGDAPGFVAIFDRKTLAIPDRPGNNRIDNLKNIIEDGRASVLFLIPGVGETLRVNGRATISADPELLARFTVDGKLPKSVILLVIESVYFHCAKSIMRSKLWDASRHVERSTLPSAGQMLKNIVSGFDGEAYDKELPERSRKNLY
ncbi:pyridoxamine 5'-phosphate oxidase family protein [Agrobacterium vitis]|uniref:pyridoxamine 5'-phosphate oxidase family protein n=1 Tax=Agrobacterium vitis TaxID=373 RepID=UPI00087343C8|nr:pyridoxamine 5'-phosphate oxidase family protein [Agrobacterium vitis]MCE6074786.1 pyridoxamine 5'-phosphate oxidase family protein [Agrobacterium vitis]MCF1451452.1 pyridoxamine 5'-phosphate oxidase family protein [Agrobacterium vitis]MCF1467354.1 pyridoxamine 5'-phosphate oxidase family protein [Agrobacterium vitis]MCM2451101.1 pyridoxamine 5'-phosphate oxidase family protein [Agrobacterium vitis]MCM2467809.1 pyridoxamine 5'-phosphate oxidase family protein [Agrobacterium vitis]